MCVCVYMIGTEIKMEYWTGAGRKPKNRIINNIIPLFKIHVFNTIFW